MCTTWKWTFVGEDAEYQGANVPTAGLFYFAILAPN